MDCRTQTAQATAARDSSAQPGPDTHLHPQPTPPGGPALIAGRAFAQTVRHFFPDFNAWLDRLPDTRVQDRCTYDRRFLAWWGLALYVLQLSARRQLDFELRDGGPQVLANFNRLAQTEQTTLPVHDTLDHFVGHVKLDGWQQLRTRMVRRLLRMKALDAARLLGRPVLLLDGTGLYRFRERHCPQCLEQRHGDQILYYHHVLEAKLLGPAGVVVSLDSEFIENADAGDRAGKTAEQIKQDCELKAFARLAPRLKKTYPQLPFVLAADSLYGCGPVFALAEKYGWSFVVTFKEGRTPALWQEFQALLPVCPDNVLRRAGPDQPAQEFRWVSQLDYEDSERRRWKVNALQCTETGRDGRQQYFAWLTLLPVTGKTVEAIAQRGGRDRWKVENEGFNRQKNSGLNLEHAYSKDPENWKAYYLLLQLAFILVQLVERGSLLRRLAAELGRPFWKLFGSLKNVFQRLLDRVRYAVWEEDWLDVGRAAELRIGLDTG